MHRHRHAVARQSLFYEWQVELLPQMTDDNLPTDGGHLGYLSDNTNCGNGEKRYEIVEKCVEHGQDIDVDDLFKPLGGFGKFQAINLTYLCVLVFFCPFSELGYVFTTAEVTHR